jgi:hypothetical protein
MSGIPLLESFLYGSWIGGQTLFWFFLKHQTEIREKQYWEALLLRLESVRT